MVGKRSIFDFLWVATLLGSCCLQPVGPAEPQHDSGVSVDSGTITDSGTSVDSGTIIDSGAGTDSGTIAAPDDGGSACTYPAGEAITPGGYAVAFIFDGCARELSRPFSLDGGSGDLICPECSDADSTPLDNLEGKCGVGNLIDCSTAVFQCYLDAGPAVLSKSCAAAIATLSEMVLNVPDGGPDD